GAAREGGPYRDMTTPRYRFSASRRAARRAPDGTSPAAQEGQEKEMKYSVPGNLPAMSLISLPGCSL
ncbi:MAG TPA: hypothetical protein VGA01_14410, partial [Candidatus Binatia bacterium]